MDAKLINDNSFLIPSQHEIGVDIERKAIYYFVDKSRNCSSFLEKIRLKGMGELKNVRYLGNNRFECPFKLNPQSTTFADVALFAKIRLRLSDSTIEKHLRYARYMEMHTIGVNFRNPSFGNFIKHMDYREQIEKASPDALNHEWKAIKMFLRAWSIPFGIGTEWDYKPPPSHRNRLRILPFPETVNKFFHFNYSSDKYETMLYRYLFCHSFMIGWRVPSEIVNMKKSDVVLDGRRSYIVITESKKHFSKRTLRGLEKALLASSIHLSLKNWMDCWRSKVENQYSEDALYLQPNGKPFTVRHLGHMLSKYGKMIFPSFRPYDMRHWCAVARLIQTKVKTGNYDCYTIRNWLGHERITTTEGYIQHADTYYKQASVDWIAHALKPYLGGKQRVINEQKKHTYKINRSPFLGLLNRFFPVRENGPAEI